MPGRSGGFYLQGRGFLWVFSSASAVRLFHRVDARWLSSRFRFPFSFHRLFFVCTFVVVELANSINASPPVNTWWGPYCELYRHAVCTWKLWNLPLSWFVYERIRLNLIIPRVSKIERSLHVKMLDSMLFNKILRNHLLFEICTEIMHHSMLPLLISCTRSWTFAWHLLWLLTTESKNIVKLLAIQPNHSHRFLRGRLFSKGKI